MTHWLTEIMMTQAATMIHAKYLLWKFGCWNTRVEYGENNSRTYEKIKIYWESHLYTIFEIIIVDPRSEKLYMVSSKTFVI